MSESSGQSCSSAPGIDCMTDSELTSDEILDLILDDQFTLILDQPTEPFLTYGEKMCMNLLDSETFLMELDTKDYSTLAY